MATVLVLIKVTLSLCLSICPPLSLSLSLFLSLSLSNRTYSLECTCLRVSEDGYSQVDMLGVWYKSVNCAAGKSQASPNRGDQID